MKKLIRFLRDKTGAQTIEWALIAAIVVLVAVLAYDELGAGGLKAKLVGAATVGGVSLGNGGGGGSGGGNGGDNNGKGGGCGDGTGGGQGGGCKK